MVELLLELLALLLEFLAELALELAGEALLDLAIPGFLAMFGKVEFRNHLIGAFGFVVLGAAAGGVSVLLFPRPLVHPSRLHGISLLLAPLTAGAAMWLVGTVFRRRGKAVIQLETFWCGFAFAFGMALVRLFTIG